LTAIVATDKLGDREKTPESPDEADSIRGTTEKNRRQG